MKNNLMKQAWLALALALASLLAIEAIQARWPVFFGAAKRSSFFPAKAEVKEELGLVLTGGEKFDPSLVPTHTSRASVRQLFQDLEKHRRKRVRIAYFADSITEGDVITEVLRAELQGYYGGKGLGLQGLDPRDAGFRISLNLAPDGRWTRKDWTEARKDPLIPLGIQGEAYHVAEGQEGAAVKLQAPSRARKSWYEKASFIWGSGPLTLRVGDASYKLIGRDLVNRFEIPGAPVNSLKIEMLAPPTTWGFGVSLESQQGVLVDNFSFRGNGGENLATTLDGARLEAFQRVLGFDLVMLHFGINALHDGDTSYHWYRVGLRKSLEHFKRHFPGARVVLVSVVDRAVKGEDGLMRPDASLPYLLAAQEAAASDAGVWFLNLYKLMGGEGSMQAWVTSSPPLANKDYTHPNRRGGGRLARLIKSSLLGEKIKEEKPEAAEKDSHAQ